MGAFDAAYVANSDPAGYAFFHGELGREAVDEVNWWSPRATLSRALGNQPRSSPVRAVAATTLTLGTPACPRWLARIAKGR